MRKTSSALLAALALAACSRAGQIPRQPVTTTAAPPTSTAPPTTTETPLSFQEFDVPRGANPHDVAPATDGGVWYTAQATGDLGHLDPSTGKTRQIELGGGSSPHGVIVGPDGAPWITDGGLNAIVRVDPKTDEVRRFPLNRPRANLNTAAFDSKGTLWFTGQSGLYGSVNPASGEVRTFDAPKGRGPYGATTTPDGTVWFSSLAGSYIARIDSSSSEVEVHSTPSPGAGARRVWSDSKGKLWVSEWFAGNLARFDPAASEWNEWKLPGESPQPYAVYVDSRDRIWLTDFASNSFVGFDPATETFESFALPSPGAEVRQMLGRPGELWGAESGTDKLVVLK